MSSNGDTLAYLFATQIDDLTTIEAAGGQVVNPKLPVPESPEPPPPFPAEPPPDPELKLKDPPRELEIDNPPLPELEVDPRGGPKGGPGLPEISKYVNELFRC